MMMSPGAVDTSGASARNAFRDLVAQPPATGSRRYWLLDPSALPRQGWLARWIGRAAWVDLLSGAAETRLNGASPVLVSADAQSEETSRRLADELYRVGRLANSVALIVSKRNLLELQSGLRQRVRIKLTGGLEAVLRCFDTRTLPLLPRLLTPAQYAQFTDGIERWTYLDRWGVLQDMPPAVCDAVGTTSARPAGLHLDDAQEALLIADGLTDAVIDFFLTQRHPVLLGRTPPEQYELIDHLLASARLSGLCEHADAIAFVERRLADDTGLSHDND